MSSKRSPQNFRLWTPIANALEAYRRRVLADPDAVYEHTWRLIHLAESTVQTSACLLASRILSNGPPAAANRVRRRLTGLAVPGTELQELPAAEACLEGYIKPWIDLLSEFAKEKAAGKFGEALHGYLDEEADALPFLDSWRMIADVPSVYSGRLKRVQRFEALNTIRNKLAHVPVPHRVLEGLSREIRKEVHALLSPLAVPEGMDILSTKWHAPLVGRLHVPNAFLHGTREFDPRLGDGNGANGLQAEAEGDRDQLWPLTPLIRVDGELKVSILVQLVGVNKDPESRDFQADYHRFAAEFRPIERITLCRGAVEVLLPTKMETAGSEKASTEGEAHSLAADPRSPAELRSEADQAFRERDYRRAVDAYDRLAKTGDSLIYNDVAMSKHGGALWRAANEAGNPVELERAIELLREATGHRDPGYRARSFYELSKALWHLYEMTNKKEHRTDALDRAEAAARTQSDPSFISWVDRLHVMSEGHDAARHAVEPDGRCAPAG